MTLPLPPLFPRSTDQSLETRTFGNSVSCSSVAGIPWGISASTSRYYPDRVRRRETPPPSCVPDIGRPIKYHHHLH